MGRRPLGVYKVDNDIRGQFLNLNFRTKIFVMFAGDFSEPFDRK